MLALKSLIAVGAFALLIPGAMAANDSASPQGIQNIPQGVTAPSNAVPPSGIGGGSNPSCTKTKTPEQRAAKKAQKAQHVAEGQQPKTAGKNGAAGGRKASRCKTSQPT